MYVAFLWVAFYLLIGVALGDHAMAAAEKGGDERAKNSQIRAIAVAFIAVAWPFIVLAHFWGVLKKALLG